MSGAIHQRAIHHVVIIGSVWPEPRSSAAGSNMLGLIKRFLADDWQVTFASPAQTGETRADLLSLGVKEHSISLNCSSFDAWIAAQQPDMVLFDRFMMEEQFGWRVEQSCPDALRVLDTEDLHCLRDVRRQLLKVSLTTSAHQQEQLPVFERSVLLQHLRVSELAMRELAAIYRSDLSLVLSDVEIRLLQDLGVPAALLHHTPFMLDPGIQPLKAFSERRDFVCIGNFHHAPNWDAVLWLKQVIWPYIRARLPQASVSVYGAYTPQKAREIHAPAEGFHIMGWAEDAHTVMMQARVCLAPLRFGAGIKGKLADAMMCGTPSVTTSIGAEGMHGELPWAGAVTDDVQAFAREAVRLHEDESLWVQAQNRGAAILRTCFDNVQIGNALINRLETCKQSLPAHRAANITGALLRHHHQKSTMYMARWIEAKNRLSVLLPESGT